MGRRKFLVSMPDEVNRNKLAEAQNIGTTPPERTVPAWRRYRVGWAIAVLLVVSWVAFLLMVNGIGFLIYD